jgi:heavy metal sensor kinase
MSNPTPPPPGVVRRALVRARNFLHSLRFRITLWFVAILGVVMAVFSAFIYTQQARDISHETLDQLALRGRQLVTYFRIVGLQFSPDGQLIVPRLANDSPFLQPGEILVLVDQQGKPIYTVGPIDSPDVQKIVAFGLQHGLEAGPFSYAVAEATQSGSPFQQSYYFAMATVPFDDGTYGVVILGSTADPGGQLQRLLLTLVGGSLVTVAVAWFGGYWLADRALRPVRTITRTARSIGETDLNQRLNLGAHDELGELADTFDGMLERLQAAFERQRQFTADASHELRTPLTIIDLESGRALNAPRTTKEYERVLTVIQSENDYMTRLVNDLLALARMDAGQTHLAFEAVDLSDVALDVIERLAPLGRRRGVALRAGDLPELRVSGDSRYLTQMLTNLVENAIKYAGGDDKTVCVSTGSRPSGSGPLAWVRVQDAGPGIPTEHLPHLFERFYRADAARTRSSQSADGTSQADDQAGSGLGLAIVQWVAQAHGGQVSVESELGRGSVFEVTIPLRAPEAEFRERPVGEA